MIWHQLQLTDLLTQRGRESISILLSFNLYQARASTAATVGRLCMLYYYRTLCLNLAVTRERERGWEPIINLFMFHVYDSYLYHSTAANFININHLTFRGRIPGIKTADSELFPLCSPPPPPSPFRLTLIVFHSCCFPTHFHLVCLITSPLSYKTFYFHHRCSEQIS